LRAARLDQQRDLRHWRVAEQVFKLSFRSGRMAIHFENIKEFIGSRVSWDDRADVFTPEAAAAIRAMVEERTVLVFPQLNLTDDEQRRITDALGEKIKLTGRFNVQTDVADDIYQVTLDPKINPQPEYVLGTFFWHMDGVTIDQPLPKATFLSARKLSSWGGQTEFASTFAAYDGLSDEQKAAIADLKVIHRMEASMRPMYHTEMPEERLSRYRAMATEMVHPLVWSQGDGRKSLVLGTHADEMIGQPLANGRSLIARLMEWAGQPAYTYSHEWQEGDFVIWNNCGVMHRVVPYDEDSGRSMHRTTIMGDQRLGHPLATVQAA
jgi:alpha-ketoglutarate-dependent taurine dioxygenase